MGVQQEENGERYQAGAKAVRHYGNAILCYQAALQQCQPSDLSSLFDSFYNAARVQQILASDHLPAPECATVLEEAISGFKKALDVSIEDEGRVVDCMSNLGCALTLLMGMILDSAVPGAQEEVGIRLGWEAKTVLAEVLKMQQEELARGPEGGAEMGKVMMAIAGGGDEGDTIPEDPEERQTALVVSMVDTVLESTNNDIALFTHLQSNSPESSNLLIAFAQETPQTLSLVSDLVLQQTQCNELPAEILLAVVEVVSTFSDSPSFPAIPLLYETISFSALELMHRNNVDVLSSWADSLIENIAPSDGDALAATVAVSQCKHAVSLYGSAFSLLSNRLRPPPKLPLYTIPALVSSNFSARATATLIAHHHSSTADPPLEAQRLALEAIEVSGVGIKISLVNERIAGILKLPGDGRKDWKTIRAFREGIMTLLRVRMRLAGIDLVAEREAAGKIWKEVTGREWAPDVALWVKDIRGDSCWESSRGEEEAGWKILKGQDGN